MASRRDRGGGKEYTLGWIPRDLPAKVKAFLRRYPAFTESWFLVSQRSNAGAIKRALIDTRAQLSASELHCLLEYQIAIPQEYGIPPIYWADALAIARSKLTTEEWYRRHPGRLVQARDNQDDYWDEKLAHLRKQGVVVVEGPDVARRRSERLARKRKRDN